MNMLQLLSILLPIVAVFSVLLIVFVNIFLKIRKRYPIRVNCWFCNSYCQVRYEEQNSFYCPSCLQYNGFTEDGGYNKLIPEQHDELLNTFSSGRQITKRASNGLCRFCNNNQQLKVQQLAKFVPLNENNYDVEIEHFQTLLEKAYKLCPKCEQVLHHTLSEQSKWFIGQKILSVHKKSMSLLDLSKPSKCATVRQKKVFFNFLLYFTLILISVLLLSETLTKLDFSKLHINRFVPAVFYPAIAVMKTYFKVISTIYNFYYNYVADFRELHDIRDYVNSTLIPVKLMIKEQLNVNLTDNFYVEFLMVNIPTKLLNHLYESIYEIALVISGVFLQLSTSLLGKHKIYTTVLWIILLAVPYIPYDQHIITSIKVFILFVILVRTSKNSRLKKKSSKNTRNKFSTTASDSTLSMSSFSDSSFSDLSTSIANFNVTSANCHNLNLSGVSARSRKSIRNKPEMISANLQISTSPKPTFGEKAVISSPLLKSPSIINANKSMCASTTSSKSCKNTSADTQSIQSGIMNLSLGKSPNHIPYSTNNVFRTKPVLSPPRFVFDKRPTCWSTDNWLKQNEGPFTSRCSSQTSGFVSNPPYDFNKSPGSSSLPNSASGSFCGDLDRTSVVSEPIISPGKPSFGSLVFSNKAGANTNISTASNFCRLINKSKYHVNTNGLFKPIVYNSDELSNNSELDLH